MNFIKHIIEPNHLILSWQSKSRLRLFVAKLTRHNGDCDLLYLTDHPDYKQAVTEGFNGYPAFPISQTNYTNVMDVFKRRIPQRARADFDQYLQPLRIPAGSSISDFALLGYSGAKLPDDGFFIFHPFDNHNEEPCELMTLVAGFRHYPTAMKLLTEKKLGVGSPVLIESEPNNEYDSLSVQVIFEGIKLGNLNRGFLPSANEWIKQKRIISADIERINGDSEHPKVYIFLKVGAK